MGRFLNRMKQPWKEDRIGFIPRTCCITGTTIFPFSKVYLRRVLTTNTKGIKWITQWAKPKPFTIAKLKGKI